MRVLVTGASGFVGTQVCADLARSGCLVRAALHERRQAGLRAEPFVVGDIDASTDWTAALAGVDTVIHLAARVHQMRDTAGTDRYAATNVHGTGRLVEASARAGVQRFVFLSSIKVNGDDTGAGAFRPTDPPHPSGAYAQSKLLAERLVMENAAAARLQWAIVRPPLVYGAGVRANFLRMLDWVDRQRPLPLGAVHNRRSLVSVWNLSDLLVKLATAAAPVERLWLVSDGEDLSTPELLRRLGKAMDRRVRLLSVSPALLRLCGGLLRRSEEVSRLIGSLAIDMDETRRLLNWAPPVSVDEALARTVSWYRARPVRS